MKIIYKLVLLILCLFILGVVINVKVIAKNSNYNHNSTNFLLENSIEKIMRVHI